MTPPVAPAVEDVVVNVELLMGLKVGFTLLEVIVWSLLSTLEVISGVVEMGLTLAVAPVVVAAVAVVLSGGVVRTVAAVVSVVVVGTSALIR